MLKWLLQKWTRATDDSVNIILDVYGIKFHTSLTFKTTMECYQEAAYTPRLPPSWFSQNEFVSPLISSSLALVNFIPFAPGIRPIMTGWKWLVPPLFTNQPWQMGVGGDDRGENFAAALKKKNDVCNQIVSISISYCVQLIMASIIHPTVLNSPDCVLIVFICSEAHWIDYKLLFGGVFSVSSYFTSLLSYL